MGCDISVLKTTDDDITYLANNLREMDFLEVFLATGKRPQQAIEDSVKFSIETYTYFYKGDLIGITGVGPHTQDTSIGIPWLLGTNRLYDIPVTLIKEGKRLCSKWMMKYRFLTLTNVVYYENLESIKYLEYLGFENQGETLDAAFTGEPFYIYTKARK